MGQAKQRGTREQRVALAVEKKRIAEFRRQEEWRIAHEKENELKRQRLAKLAAMPEEDRKRLNKSRERLLMTAMLLSLSTQLYK